MRTKIFILGAPLFLTTSVNAQMPGMDMSKPTLHKKKIPFEISGRQEKTLSEENVSDLLAKQNKNQIISDHAFITNDNESQVVVTTGPAEDMLSYRIQGMRNPILAMKPGTKLHIVFVNTDDGMHHDMRFGASPASWSSSPDITATVGTENLSPVLNKKIFMAEPSTFRNSDTILTSPKTEQQIFQPLLSVIAEGL